MSESFTTVPFPEMLGRFSSKEPIPGGGSASAIAGALAAALGEMVGALTLGKKGYESHQGEIETLRAEARVLTRRLLAAAEEDAEAYQGVMAAMGLPKDTDQAKATRREAMQSAFIGATEPPLQAARTCLAVGRLGLRMLIIGNRNASSDAAVATLLAIAGGEGSLLNVAINLSSIQDADLTARLRAEAEGIWAGLSNLRRDMWTAAHHAGLEGPPAEVRA
ncbi:MAG: cyclodeaminase/cyclohydrolase family protein [Candidatus Sericytochromatia bacterium]|nr:cyclodeaminase/cyclohydrolase family protein [Candidatus Sericytochromatia bacterium]